MVAKYPFSWLAHRCTPLNLNPGGCAFWLICPCHELLMAGPAGALYLVTIYWPWQGTNVFLGSVSRTRGRKELAFSFADLEPDGCLVADQLASATSTFENPGVDDQKVQIRLWVLFLQKFILFCDGQVFFIDRGLLMGANSTTLLLLQIPNEYHNFGDRGRP